MIVRNVENRDNFKYHNIFDTTNDMDKKTTRTIRQES